MQQVLTRVAEWKEWIDWCRVTKRATTHTQGEQDDHNDNSDVSMEAREDSTRSGETTMGAITRERGRSAWCCAERERVCNGLNETSEGGIVRRSARTTRSLLLRGQDWTRAMMDWRHGVDAWVGTLKELGWVRPITWFTRRIGVRLGV